MSTMALQSAHINFLTKPWFEIQIEKLNFFNNLITGINLPGFTIGSTELPTPHIAVPVPGDHMTFDQLNVRFTLDEEFKAYRELYEWAIKIGSPDNFEQRKPLAEVYSSASILLLSSAKNPVIKIQLLGMIPIKVDGIELDSQRNSAEPLTSMATFSFRKFELTSAS